MDVREVRKIHFERALAAEPGPERGRKTRFAARIGKGTAQISQWLSGYRKLDAETAREIEAKLHAPRFSFDSVEDLEISPAPPSRGLAQDMSQYRITVAPQTIAWEQLTVIKDRLPDTFTLTLPDDALTPRLRRGDQVELNRRLTAEPGDLVLVRDSAGEHYVREYRRHRPDDWTAAALNGAYTSLVASQDQLEIIAVVEWERRGRHRD